VRATARCKWSGTGGRRWRGSYCRFFAGNPYTISSGGDSSTGSERSFAQARGRAASARHANAVRSVPRSHHIENARSLTPKVGGRGERVPAELIPVGSIRARLRPESLASRSDDHERISIISESEAHVLGVLDNVLVALTREPPSIESVEGFTEHAQRLMEKYSDGISVVIIPRAPKPAFRPGVARAVLRAWKLLHPHMACASILIRSTGVAGALQRGLITPLINSRPSALPVKLSANPYHACEWVARHNPRHTGDALALGRALARFLEDYERAPAEQTI